MQDTQQQSSRGQITTETPTVIINSDGDFVDANDAGAEIQGYSRGEMLTLNINDTLLNPSIEDGRIFEKALNGEITEATATIRRKNGGVAELTCELTALTIEGEKHIRSQTVNIEEKECESVDSMTFEDIPEETLSEITRNIRIDAATELTLAEAVADLAAAQNELEQFKNGALTLQSAIDERLREEEERNPGSMEVEVLREAKKSAGKVYRRAK